METNSTNPAPEFCAACGERLSAGARFCHACGSPAGVGVARRLPGIVPWSIAGLAVIALVALVAGQSYGRRRTESASIASTAPLAAVRAPDIASMPPEERAQRLFSRVIAYASAGRDDSAAFFAPMAMGAFAALAPLSSHHRFDVGLIAFAIGDMATAAAQADSIFAAEPQNLLGLALAMQTADAGGDSVKRNSFARRLLAAEQHEMGRQLPEYLKHEPELRAAIEAAKGHGS